MATTESVILFPIETTVGHGITTDTQDMTETTNNTKKKNSEEMTETQVEDNLTTESDKTKEETTYKAEAEENTTTEHMEVTSQKVRKGRISCSYNK